MRSVSCAGRRQLLLAGLEVQLIAARRILGDGDDRCFTVFALGTLNTLLALRSRTAAVALHTLWTDLALNMQEDKEAVFDCVDTVKMCLRVFTPMIAAMKACTCNMYRAAQRGFLNATDLADYLTKKGLPFRAAYKIAGQLVAYCIEHTTVLEELPLALLRQYSERFGEDVYAAIALTNCVTGRTSLGGTCVASRLQSRQRTVDNTEDRTIISDSQRAMSPLTNQNLKESFLKHIILSPERVA